MANWPVFSAMVGTVEITVSPSRARRKSESRKKNQFLPGSGPPRVAPNWLRVAPGFRRSVEEIVGIKSGITQIVERAAVPIA